MAQLKFFDRMEKRLEEFYLLFESYNQQWMEYITSLKGQQSSISEGRVRVDKRKIQSSLRDKEVKKFSSPHMSEEKKDSVLRQRKATLWKKVLPKGVKSKSKAKQQRNMQRRLKKKFQQPRSRNYQKAGVGDGERGKSLLLEISWKKFATQQNRQREAAEGNAVSKIYERHQIASNMLWILGFQYEKG